MVNIEVIKETYYNQQKIVLIRIVNSSGSYVELTNYGASIVSIVVPNKKEELGNVILSYNKLEDYFTDSYYIGATVGRFANRISNAKFSLNDQTYFLDKNDGDNSNHGGFHGFNTQVYSYRLGENEVTFILNSEDGAGGFPGNLSLEVTYRLASDCDTLSIEYKAVADQYTPVNFTNHSYFNLADTKQNIGEHHLKVNCDNHLEMDNNFLPTGKLLKVKNSAFDFVKPVSIEGNSKLKKDNLLGYNAYYIAPDDLPKGSPLATLYEKDSGRVLEVSTSMSGIQLYTGDFLDNAFLPFEGVCLEAQYYPDGVNHSHFKSCVLTPNEVKVDSIEYKFYCI